MKNKFFLFLVLILTSTILHGQVLTTKLPIIPLDTTGGNVSFKYYLGTFNKVSDYAKLTPNKTGSTKNFNVNNSVVADNFGVEFESYVYIDTFGIIKFGVSSDDGSKLFIDSILVVDNDGLHSDIYKEGSIKLTRGSHKIKVQYMERTGDQKLRVFWQPFWKPAKELVPESILSKAPINILPKVVGVIKLFDVEIKLWDNLTWEYSEILN